MVVAILSSARCQLKMDSSHRDKRETAPLARTESFDDEEYDDGVIAKLLVIDDEDEELLRQRLQRSFELETPSSPASASGSGSLRKTTNKKKQRVTGLNGGEPSSSSEEIGSLSSSFTGSKKSKSHRTEDFNLMSDITRLSCVVDRLTEQIELSGISAEGIYRKSGGVKKVTKLRRKLQKALRHNKDEVATLDLAAYSNDIHVLTSVLKSLFRDMREPLITRELRPQFTAAVDIADDVERSASIDRLLSQLPQPNQQLLDKLVQHLIRVVQKQSHNRMSAESLAIVFAPNIMSAQQEELIPAVSDITRTDVEKQTKCLRYIIESYMQKMSGEKTSTSTGDGELSAVDGDSVVTDEQLAVATDSPDGALERLAAFNTPTSTDHLELEGSEEHDSRAGDDDEPLNATVTSVSASVSSETDDSSTHSTEN